MCFWCRARALDRDLAKPASAYSGSEGLKPDDQQNALKAQSTVKRSVAQAQRRDTNPTLTQCTTTGLARETNASNSRQTKEASWKDRSMGC